MKRLELSDFRCFDHLEVDFKSGINLLIGDNGSGKTSLLQGCKYALSSFFAGFSDENTKWVSPSYNDFRIRMVDDETLVGEMPIQITFTQDDLFDGSEGTYTIEKRSKKNSRPLLAGLLKYRNASRQLQASFFSDRGDSHFLVEKPLPLFASFSTEDIHTVRKIGESQFLKFQNKPSFGYFECLDCNGLLKYWVKRLLVLSEAKRNNLEIEVVRSAIIDALGTNGCYIINDMMVRPISRKVVYQFIDGREVELDYLSDGYKRLVNIVTDLAFRCVLLNKSFYGEQCAKETKGTVLIDEIDMHLHPRLQARVLKGLQNAFPKIQFIVATHAPMVMTGVVNDSKNSVCKLDYVDGKYTSRPVETYGLSASDILRIILDVLPRDPGVEAKLNGLFDALDKEDYDKAKNLFNLMTREFDIDKIPELVQARAMLNFNIVDDD